MSVVSTQGWKAAVCRAWLLVLHFKVELNAASATVLEWFGLNSVTCLAVFVIVHRRHVIPTDTFLRAWALCRPMLSSLINLKKFKYPACSKFSSRRFYTTGRSVCVWCHSRQGCWAKPHTSDNRVLCANLRGPSDTKNRPSPLFVTDTGPLAPLLSAPLPVNTGPLWATQSDTGQESGQANVPLSASLTHTQTHMLLLRKASLI